MFTIYCVHCRAAHDPAKAQVIPSTCPSCGGTAAWTTLAPSDTPTVPYLLNADDRAFLAEVGIARAS